MGIDEEILLVLLNAKAKNTIEDIFLTAFRFRYDGVSERKLAAWSEELESSIGSIRKLVESITALIQKCLFNEQLPSNILSPSFHQQLIGLLDKIVAKRRDHWRESCLNNSISPPKLVSYECCVDTKMASNSLAKMSQSSILLSLTVEDVPKNKGIMPTQNVVNLELSKQELSSLLDGFTKIRDQLGTINSN